MKSKHISLLATTLLAIFAAGCLTRAVDGAKGPTIPDEIKMPDNEKLSFSLIGIGTQTYACQAKNVEKTQFEWSSTPEADLYDYKGVRVGKHKGGPTWESLDGSSKVVGDKNRVKKAQALGADAIDWLLLPTKSNAGSGLFSKVTSIQRIDTVGGKGPQGPCDPSNSKPLSVYYSTTYYFNVAKP